MQLRKYSEAADELRRAVQVLDKHVTYRTNLAHVSVLSGDFQGAEDQVRALEQPGVRAVLALAYSQMGRAMLPEAAQSYQQMQTMGPTGQSAASLGLGDLAVYEGRYSDAIRIFEQGAAADLAAKTPDNAATKFVSIAYAHLRAGKTGAAIAAADNAMLNARGMSDRYLAARVFAEAGAVDKAKAVAATLSKEPSAELRAHGKIIEGLIALKGGNAGDAITILTGASAILDTWLGHLDLGRAYLATKAFTQADSEFESCINRRGEAITLMGEGATYGQFPIVYYYRGLAREGIGTAGFAESYRGSLKIRGNSKEDPLLTEVRRRAGNQ